MMKQIIYTVVGCALGGMGMGGMGMGGMGMGGMGMGGMGMGGLFGWGAGTITPDFFGQAIPWWNIEPVGLAVFLGATAGVVLGGGLGCFAIIVHGLFNREKPQMKPE